MSEIGTTISVENPERPEDLERPGRAARPEATEATEATGVVVPAESAVEDQRILGPRYRALTIGIIAAVLMTAFEAMAVTTAMPIAVRDLNGLPLYAWGFSGFMTASMFATIVSGELSDRFGPVRPFLGGLALFGAGLVVAGAAPTMPIFVLGRALGGLGGGALVVSLFVIAGRAYPKELLPRLMAAFSSAWVLPSIVGPLVSGAVSEHLTWRLVFLGLLPILALPLVLMRKRLRELPTVEPGSPVRRRAWFALATAVGIALLQYAGQDLRWLSLVFLAVGAALLVPSLPRLLPAGALRFARGLPSVVGMKTVLSGAFFGTQSFLPLMLTQHRHLTATEAGLILTAGSLGWSTGSWWQGRPGMSIPRHRVVRLGVVGVTLGMSVPLLAVWSSVPVLVVVPGVIVAGLGMGIGTSSLQVLLLSESPVEEQGANSAAGQLADSMGQVIFIGLGGVLFATLNGVLTGGAVFVPIFAVMVGVGLFGVTVAMRVASRASGADGRITANSGQILG